MCIRDSWISLFGFSFQPSELAKPCYIFAGAATLERLFRKRNLGLFILLTGVCTVSYTHLVAVSTHCGCFVYGNTSANTHRVAAALMDTGIPAAELNKRHFRTKSFRRLRLESLLTESIEFHDGGEIAIAAISLEMLARLQATEADAEDIAAFVGQVEGVRTGVTVRELKPGLCKISLRTDPKQLNASAVCTLLGGGGHAAASGATVEGDIQRKMCIRDRSWTSSPSTDIPPRTICSP